jgi:hypothetical protein
MRLGFKLALGRNSRAIDRSDALARQSAPHIPPAGAWSGTLRELDQATPPRPREARRLARKSPKTGKRRSLRSIAAELATTGHLGRPVALTRQAA